MATTLGAPKQVSAVIHTKGRARQVAAPYVLAAAAWERVLDGTSTARCTIPVAGNKCTELADVEPWSHELALYRDEDLVWEGPISRITDSRANRTIVIEARDVTAWLDRRICKGYDQTGQPVELTVTAKRMVDAVLAIDDPGIRPYITLKPTTILVERVVEPNSIYALADLKALAQLGLNFTAVGRRLILFGVATPLATLRRLADRHFTGDLPLVITDAVRTAASMVGDGVVGRFGAPSPRYGLLEELTRADGVLEQYQLDRAARGRVNGRPPVLIDGSSAGALTKMAPVRLGDLVPGAQGEVTVAGNCRRVLRPMRLEQLKVEWQPGKEAVTPVFVPINEIEAE